MFQGIVTFMTLSMLPAVAPSDVAVLLPPMQLPVGQKPKPQQKPRKLVGGFGPAVLNEEKAAMGIRCNDQPKCTDPSHSDKEGWFRQKSSCRPCLKEAVEGIPPSATRWQAARYLNALFRCYFCPFCFLELERDELHNAPVKSRCTKHVNLNRTTKCQHDHPWKNCKECLHDPRSATDFCPCGSRNVEVNGNCTCPAGLKEQSYGLRFGTNPFIVPTDEVRAREELMASESLALAALMQLSGEEVPPAKKRRVTTD